MTKVLVTGATGNVGGHVAPQLSASGIGTRAIARHATGARFPDGVEAVDGDLSQPDTLDAALVGVETVFLIWPFLTVEGAPAVLDVMARHARRLVYVSSSGVIDGGGRQTDPINQLHADMERLIAKSALEWTILRSDTIASNALGWAGQIRDAGVVRGPDIAATAVIDERDVAAVAVRALTEDGHAGATHVLTGPQMLSRADQVRIIGEAIGRPLDFESVPVQAAREQMLADGRPPALVDALLASAEHRPTSDLVTTTVQGITGAAARAFREWARDNAHRFRPST